MLHWLNDVFRRDRLPIWFFWVGGLSALSMVVPDVSGILIYNREAILGGQIWRLLTGNCVHFGWTHWFLDTGLFLILGRVLEWQYGRFLKLSLFLLALAVTGAVFLFDPTMPIYGGLSGMNVGLLVFLACRGWQRDWTDWFWPAVLAIHVVELIIETRNASSGGGMIKFSDPTIHVATIAHIGGVVAGLLMWVWLAGRSRAGRSIE